MSILDLIDIEKVRRAIMYIAVLFGTLVLQNMVISRFPIFGAKALFVPALIVAIGLFEGGVWGGVFGLIAGLLGDSAFSGNTVLFTIVFPILGFCAGLLADFMINRRFFSFMLLALISLGVTALSQVFPLFAFEGAALGDLLSTAVVQTLWSFPFAAPIYLVVKKIAESSED